MHVVLTIIVVSVMVVVLLTVIDSWLMLLIVCQKTQKNLQRPGQQQKSFVMG
jgi:hypothetical protein